MYAVVRTGGKQYRVSAGDILEVEKLDGNIGEEITLDDVLMVANGDAVTVGQPLVDSASVQAVITGQHRGKKIQVMRYRPKKRIRVRKGHRQYLTRLEIESIKFGDETYRAPEPVVVEEPAEEEVVADGNVAEIIDMEAPQDVVDEVVETIDEAPDEAIDEVVSDEIVNEVPALDPADEADSSDVDDDASSAKSSGA